MLMLKRIISMALVLVMVAGVLPPVGARAEQMEEAPAVEETAEATMETTATFAETEEIAPEESVEAPEETTAPVTEPEKEPQFEASPTEETAEEETFYAEAALPDSDELYEGYLHQLFFGNGGIELLGTLARDTLSDADKYLYDELKKVIIRIADGQRESTMVEVNFDGSGLDIWETDLNLVIDCLIHDCAYELYWYGGCMWSYRGSILKVWLLPVANYQPSGYDEYNPTINTVKAGRAAAAAENARAVVAQYTAYDDYDKLVAYADKICSLVKYDNSAANNNTSNININPWTLVNVFDNDTSTNVVCEGYAEAFQYLCDMSDFDGDVDCYSVTGANHKWNIVRIEGISYLMDVTHCDDGKKATKGAKFLGGGKGDIETGYVIGGFHYWYYDEVKALWGTGDDSILKLAKTKYDPAKAPEPTTITQAKFESALKNCGGSYRLTKALTLTSDLTVDGVALTLASGGSIRVTPGKKLTVLENASLALEAGAELIAEDNARVLAFGGFANNGGTLAGAGNLLQAFLEPETGMLTISGRGAVADGDLDRLSGSAQYLLVEPGITAVGQRAFDEFDLLEEVSLPEGLTLIGAKAFSGCKKLWTVNIPASVETLGDRAFQGCAGLKTVVFQGDVPKFEGGGRSFEGVTATVYYPRNNATWTEAVRKNYGGSLTWEVACVNGHDVVIIPGDPPTCVEVGLSDGEYCAACGEMLAEQRILLPTGIHTYTDEADTTCDVCGEERVIEEDFPFTEFEWEVLKLTNKKRIAAGVEPLTGFSKLQQAGDIRAEELIKYFSHNRPDGTSCYTVLKELGLDYWYAGENIASGYQTPSAVVSGWMDSQGHRENILNPSFSHMGVGEKKKNWVQLFISGGNYASIRLLEGDRLTLDPGADLDDLDLVGVLMNRWGRCYLPVSSDYCQGYDPNALGDQQVTLSVLGVSTTFTVHIHDWAEATCTTPKSCQTCGETKGEALGHKYKAAKTKPTCTENGYTTNTCKVCGDIQIEENAPALGHKEVIDKAVAPTCTKAGLAEGKHCSVCGEVLTAQLVVDALGHTVITDAGYAPTCIRTGLTEGQHCERCGEVLTAQESLPATGHDFAAGFCRNCGVEDKADYDLYSGKNMTLKAYHPDTGGVLSAKQVTWSIGEAYEPFAAMNPNGKLTAKKVFEKVRVEAVATLVSTGEAMTYLVDIYPAVTQAEVVCRGEVVNGGTVIMDFAEESLTLKSEAYPLDTLANVTWTVSDKKAQYADYEINGDTLTISAPKSKAGTVTIKATMDAGVKKTVTVKVQLGSFAKTVEIAEPEKTTIRGGETLTLTASIVDPKVVTMPGIVWSVSDKNAATVTNGKVKAKNVAHPTTVTVTATSKDGQASNSIEIEILPKNEGQLVLMDGNKFVTNATRTISEGETFYLDAYSIVAGYPVPEAVTWVTSKGSVVRVADGMVTAVGAGSAKITAQAADGRKAILNVKVSTLVADMEITTKDGKNLIDENGETMVLLSSGKGVNLVANILTKGANKAVTWEITEGSAFAKISNGKVTANKDLTGIQYVTVKATAKDGSGYSETIRIKILPLATGVQIFESGSSIRSNTTFVCDMLTTPSLKLNARVYPAKANQTVELTSSNKKVADFVNGELVCIKPGTVTITAKALDGSNAKTTFKLTIVKKVTSLTLKEGSSLTVVGGKSLKLAPMVEISPSDATNKKLTWSVAPNDYGIKISSSGVLSTKKVTAPVTVNVMVITQDGSGEMLRFDVTVYPV